jgi:hypothetical protein
MGEGGGAGIGAVSGVSVVWGPVTLSSLPYAAGAVSATVSGTGRRPRGRRP